MGRVMVKDSDKVVDISQSIVREISESAYSMDMEGEGEMEKVDDGNSVEYI